MYTKETLVSDY